MITLGIDLSAQPKGTAACRIRWERREAFVEHVAVGVDDNLLREFAAESDKTGIDVPFGWPDAFVEAITAHREGGPWPDTALHQLRFRRTDLHVQRETGKWPLSVSTDRIGITAFRAARLLSESNADRTGAGALVEVYPAAALRRWDLEPRLDALVGRTASWLAIPRILNAVLATNRDAFDALIASLVTRAAAVGLCDPIEHDDLDAAAREGWIALPASHSLDRLGI
jgi:hypothetical protein